MSVNMLLYNNKAIFSILLLLLFLCSCGGPVECIDGDEWSGHQTVVIDSKDNSWKQAFELNGSRVVVQVKNDETKMASEGGCSSPSYYNYSRSGFQNAWLPMWADIGYNTDALCKFVEAYYTPWCPSGCDMTNDDSYALNLPCKFYMGLGLYSTIGESVSGNRLGCEVSGVGRDDTSCFKHIGDNACRDVNNCDSAFYSHNCPTAGISYTPPGECTNGKCSMYFKIEDRDYSDNLGSYTVDFKQGVKTTGSDVITKFVAKFQGILCTVSELNYKNMINQDFMAYIKVSLVLYIVILGFSVLMGFSDLTYGDLLFRALKIGLVLQLISNTSWEFFNEHFFKFFTQGIGVITGIIFGQGPGVVDVDISGVAVTENCKVQSIAGIQALSGEIMNLFSYETTRKILSLLVFRGYGILFMLIIFICMGVFIFIIIKSIIIYLVAILVISILISLAPIFISFILFDLTRQFFDKWLTTLTSYFIQPIIILTFAFFLLQIFMAQLQSLVGYRVCWKELVYIPVIGLRIYAWQADYDTDADKVCVLTPNSILKYEVSSTEDILSGKGKGGVLSTSDRLNMVGELKVASVGGYEGSCTTNSTIENNSNLCTAYSCTQMRYLGFPYLDPNSQSDSELERVDELRSGELISFKGILILIMIVWFMVKFSKAVPDLAKQLATGNVFGGVNMAGTAGRMGGAVGKVAAFAGSKVYDKATGRSLHQDLRAVGRRVTGLKEKAQDAVGGRIQGARDAVTESKLGKAVSGAGKVFLTPHKVLGAGLGKIGERTSGRARKAAEEKAKGRIDKIGNFLSGKRQAPSTQAGQQRAPQEGHMQESRDGQVGVGGAGHQEDHAGAEGLPNLQAKKMPRQGKLRRRGGGARPPDHEAVGRRGIPGA